MERHRSSRSIRPVTPRLTRRAAVVAMSAAGLTRSSVLAQTPAAPIPPGSTQGPGTHAFEYVGRIVQDGMDFTLLGYVTYLKHVDQAALFTGEDPLARTEAEARLTLTGSAMGVARSNVDRLFAVNGEGLVEFRLMPDGGASFADPASFTVGDVICTMALRIQSVINVYAPQQGLASGFGELTIDDASTFEIGGHQVSLGEPGVFYRLEQVGQGELLDPERLQAALVVAGHGVIVS